MRKLNNYEGLDDYIETHQLGNSLAAVLFPQIPVDLTHWECQPGPAGARHSLGFLIHSSPADHCKTLAFIYLEI